MSPKHAKYVHPTHRWKADLMTDGLNIHRNSSENLAFKSNKNEFTLLTNVFGRSLADPGDQF
jgi:hypothetical protein